METVNGVTDGDKGGPPPPSPLTGCYLLIVVGEPHSNQHKDIILQRIAKGLLSWDVNDCLVDLEKELAIITEQALEGEEARYGERLIQFASENLVTEILIHPVVSTLAQCMRNLLSSFTRHRHIIHTGYTFAANGSWALQDGTFSLADFSEAFQEVEVQRVIRAYENGISLDIHCSPEGDWSRLPKEPFAKACKVRVNPTDVLTMGSPAITEFIHYISPFLVPTSLEVLLESSDVVGNIRFSRPTLYVFPGGQGDAALFGINGFNMLLDGGFSRKACFWDFVRHLDRLDAVLMTRLNNSNVGGISSVLRRKKQDAVYPQIGHFFCNIQERKAILSPDGDKDKDPLLINLLDEGQEIISNLRHLNLHPQVCYRDSEPINLYHKVGHGTLDMYVLSPAKDSKEVREFLQRWNQSDQKLFANSKSSREFNFPIQNLISIAALLVWQPANPSDTITRILYPGSSPQKKIFEGLDRLKNLEFIKHPVCTEKSLTPSSMVKKSAKDALIEKVIPKEKIIDKRENKIIENNISVNGDIKEAKEKLVKKSDSTESERSTRTKKIEDSKLIENEEKPKSKPKTAKARSESQQRKRITEKKASPTTPKKTVENGDVRKPIKRSPIGTPAKSAKDANNRKVIESKTKTAKPPPAETKPKVERKPISRRPKGSMKAPISPVKKVVNGVQKPDTISRKGKLDKEGTTDSSTVSTPSADQESLLKKDISKLTTDEIQQLKAQELADLKEEQEAVKEIEAVFRKGEVQPVGDKDLRKVKDVSIEDKEKEEYLIIEREEIDHDSLDDKEVKEDEIQKLARDSEESEKQRKLSTEEKLEKQQQEAIQEQVNEIVTEAEDIVKAKEEAPDVGKDAVVTSPEDKVDLSSTDKKTTDKEVEEVKDIIESHPDEKVSIIKSGDTTTAPTLPEDERIPLDEIKEQIIEEKHVKEETKEKEVPVIQLPPKTFEPVGKVPSVVGIRLDKQSHIRDIVKTPDEVADLPVHEEVDYEYTHELKAETKTNEVSEDKKDFKLDEKAQEFIKDSDQATGLIKEQVKEIEQEKDKDEVVQEQLRDIIEDVRKTSLIQEELKHLTDKVLENEAALETDILKGAENYLDKEPLKAPGDIQQKEITVDAVEKEIDHKEIPETKTEKETAVKETEAKEKTKTPTDIIPAEVLEKGQMEVKEELVEKQEHAGEKADVMKLDKEVEKIDHKNIQDKTEKDLEKIATESKIEKAEETTPSKDIFKTTDREIKEVVDEKEPSKETIQTEIGKPVYDIGQKEEKELVEVKELKPVEGKESNLDVVEKETIEVKEKVDESDKRDIPTAEKAIKDEVHKEKDSDKDLQIKSDVKEEKHLEQKELLPSLKKEVGSGEELAKETPQQVDHKDLTEEKDKIDKELMKKTEETEIIHAAKEKIEPLKSDTIIDDVKDPSAKIDEDKHKVTEKLTDKDILEKAEQEAKEKAVDKEESRILTSEPIKTEKMEDDKITEVIDVQKESVIKTVDKEGVDELKLGVSEKEAPKGEEKHDVELTKVDIEPQLDKKDPIHVDETEKHAMEETKEEIIGEKIEKGLLEKEVIEKEAVKEEPKDEHLDDKEITEKVQDKEVVKKDDAIEEKKEKLDHTTKPEKEKIDVKAIAETIPSNKEQLDTKVVLEKENKIEEKIETKPTEVKGQTETIEIKQVQEKEEFLVNGDVQEDESIDGEEKKDEEKEYKTEYKISQKDVTLEKAKESKKDAELEPKKDKDEKAHEKDKIVVDKDEKGKEHSKSDTGVAEERQKSFDRIPSVEEVQTEIIKHTEDVVKTAKEDKSKLKEIEDRLQKLKEKSPEPSIEKIEPVKLEGELGKTEELVKATKEDKSHFEKLEEKLQELKDSAELKSQPTQEAKKEESAEEKDERAGDVLEKMELGRKSPKEREEDVIKIVTTVAEVLKSDAPLEEFEGKLPISTYSPYTSSYTTELRETHITTVDSPIVESRVIKADDIPPIPEEPHAATTSFLEEERKIAPVHEKVEDKRSSLLKESQELIKATSKIISEIKSVKPDETEDSDEPPVHRMLVTASSEDGGEETEICPEGTITFSKSSESSGRSSPEKSQELSKKSSIVDTISDSLSTVKQIRELHSEKDSGIDDVKSDTDLETQEKVSPSPDVDLDNASAKETEKISLIEKDDDQISGKSSPDKDASIKSLASGKSTPDISDLEKSKEVTSSTEDLKVSANLPKKEEKIVEKKNESIPESLPTEDAAKDGKDIVSKEAPKEEEPVLEKREAGQTEPIPKKVSKSEEPTAELKKYDERRDSLIEKIEDSVKESLEAVSDFTKSLFTRGEEEIEKTTLDLEKEIDQIKTEGKDVVSKTAEKGDKTIEEIIAVEESVVEQIEDKLKDAFDSIVGVIPSFTDKSEKKLEEASSALSGAAEHLEKSFISKTEEKIDKTIEIVEKQLENISKPHTVTAHDEIGHADKKDDKKVAPAEKPVVEKLEDSTKAAAEHLLDKISDSTGGLEETKDQLAEISAAVVSTVEDIKATVADALTQKASSDTTVVEETVPPVTKAAIVEAAKDIKAQVDEQFADKSQDKAISEVITSAGEDKLTDIISDIKGSETQHVTLEKAEVSEKQLEKSVETAKESILDKLEETSKAVVDKVLDSISEKADEAAKDMIADTTATDKSADRGEVTRRKSVVEQLEELMSDMYSDKEDVGKDTAKDKKPDSASTEKITHGETKRRESIVEQLEEGIKDTFSAISDFGKSLFGKGEKALEDSSVKAEHVIEGIITTAENVIDKVDEDVKTSIASIKHFEESIFDTKTDSGVELETSTEKETLEHDTGIKKETSQDTKDSKSPQLPEEIVKETKTEDLTAASEKLAKIDQKEAKPLENVLQKSELEEKHADKPGDESKSLTVEIDNKHVSKTDIEKAELPDDLSKEQKPVSPKDKLSKIGVTESTQDIKEELSAVQVKDLSRESSPELKETKPDKKKSIAESIIDETRDEKELQKDIPVEKQVEKKDHTDQSQGLDSMTIDIKDPKQQEEVKGDVLPVDLIKKDVKEDIFKLDDKDIKSHESLEKSDVSSAKDLPSVDLIKKDIKEDISKPDDKDLKLKESPEKSDVPLPKDIPPVELIKKDVKEDISKPDDKDLKLTESPEESDVPLPKDIPPVELIKKDVKEDISKPDDKDLKLKESLEKSDVPLPKDIPPVELIKKDVKEDISKPDDKDLKLKESPEESDVPLPKDIPSVELIKKDVKEDISKPDDKDSKLKESPEKSDVPLPKDIPPVELIKKDVKEDISKPDDEDLKLKESPEKSDEPLSKDIPPVDVIQEDVKEDLPKQHGKDSKPGDLKKPDADLVKDVDIKDKRLTDNKEDEKEKVDHVIDAKEEKGKIALKEEADKLQKQGVCELKPGTEETKDSEQHKQKLDDTSGKDLADKGEESASIAKREVKVEKDDIAEEKDSGIFESISEVKADILDKVQTDKEPESFGKTLEQSHASQLDDKETKKALEKEESSTELGSSDKKEVTDIKDEAKPKPEEVKDTLSRDYKGEHVTTDTKQDIVAVPLEKSAHVITDSIITTTVVESPFGNSENQLDTDISPEKAVEDEKLLAREDKVLEKSADNLRQTFEAVSEVAKSVVSDKSDKSDTEKAEKKKEEKTLEESSKGDIPVVTSELHPKDAGAKLTEQKSIDDLTFDKCGISTDLEEIDPKVLETEQKQLEKSADDLKDTYERVSKMSTSLSFDKCDKSEHASHMPEEVLHKEEEILEERAKDLTKTFDDVTDMSKSVVFEKCDKPEDAVLHKDEKTLEEITKDLTETYDMVTDMSKSAIFEKCDKSKDETHIPEEVLKTEKEGLEERAKDLTEAFEAVTDMSKSVIFEKCDKPEEAILHKEEKALEERAKDLTETFETVADMSKSVVFEKCESIDKRQASVEEDFAKKTADDLEETLEAVTDMSKSVVFEKCDKEYKEKSESEKETFDEKLTADLKAEKSVVKDIVDKVGKDIDTETVDAEIKSLKDTSDIPDIKAKPSDVKEVIEKITADIDTKSVDAEMKKSPDLLVEEDRKVTVPEKSEKEGMEKSGGSKEVSDAPKQAVADAKTESISIEDKDITLDSKEPLPSLGQQIIKDDVKTSVLDSKLEKDKLDKSILGVSHTEGKKLSVSEVEISLPGVKVSVNTSAKGTDAKQLESRDGDIKEDKQKTDSKDTEATCDIAKESPAPDKISISVAGPSTTVDKSKDSEEAVKQKELQDTLLHEKHIPGAVTPPTVPVSPNIGESYGEDIKLTTRTENLLREMGIRSSTPGSDDFEVITSTHSDLSSGQFSKMPLDSEKLDSDEELSVTSQIAYSRDSSHYELDDDSKISKIDQMSMSFYGALPDDDEKQAEPTYLYEITKARYSSGASLDEADAKLDQINKNKQAEEGKEPAALSASKEEKDPIGKWGKPLGLPAPRTYLYEITKARYSCQGLTVTSEDIAFSSDSEDESAARTYLYEVTKAKYSTPISREDDGDASNTFASSRHQNVVSSLEDADPIASWGKPLGLPSPAPPNDNKGTPKKERKLPPNVTARNKLNDDKKRAESPSKYKNKKVNPVYVDLTYVPHHGNAYYSYVDFFKRVRARYYVFSGIEPSREVYNALLEAKQTWEDKELEVTIIPTYDTDILGYWVAENEELLTKYKIDLSPSASRCTINLQDHETSCSAYRLEF